MYAPTEGGSGDDIRRPMPDRLRVKLVGCVPRSPDGRLT